MRYEFVVTGRLSETAVAAFPELKRAERSGSDTRLFGPVLDRAHFDGLLARFSAMGLDVLDIHRLPD